jgi:ABC-2 type transport system permease protein
MDCIFYGISIAFFEILFMHTDNLAGWQSHEVLFFVATTLVIDSVFMTVFAKNIWEFPSLVNQGTLDYHLIRPARPLFMILFRYFEFASLLNLFVAIGILVYALMQFPALPDLTTIIGYLILLINSILLFICLRLLTVIPVFWTHSTFGFHMLFQSLEKVSNQPDVIYNGAFKVFFSTFVPVLVITSYPAKLFFNKLSFSYFAYSLCISCMFILLIRFIWNRGLREYSSASS